MKEPIFWEKSVEYCFLLRLARNQGAVEFAAPLDGRHEKMAGDAVFGIDNKLLLVEFKARHANIASERAKFRNYGAAQTALKGKDQYHLLIYADGHTHLKLLGCLYFDHDKQVNLDNLDPHLATPKQFAAYLKAFVAHRDDEKGGGASLPEFASVMGLNAEGQLVNACTLAEYCDALSLRPKRAPNPSVPSTRQSRGPR